MSAIDRIFSFAKANNARASGTLSPPVFRKTQEFTGVSSDSVQTNQGKAINPATNPKQ
jgi:hypothetical protein